MSIKKITSAILAVALCFGTAMPTMGNAAVYPVEGEIVNTYDESKNTLGDVDSNGTIDSVDALQQDKRLFLTTYRKPVPMLTETVQSIP